MECELESYLSVLEPFAAQIAAVEQDLFLSQCSPQRLAQFERILAIPVNDGIPLKRRREIAASKMAIGPSDFNRAGLEQCLNAVGIKAKVEENSGSGSITVTAHEIADSAMTLDEAKEAFHALMPAHLTAEFVTGGLDFAEFDALNKTFLQLDRIEKSWSQLEMMGIEQWQEVENVQQL